MIAHIVHNPARKDRLQNLMEQTADQGIVYQLWPAIMDENPIRGCHLAHRAVVQFAKEQKFPAVWIMEDDVKFTAPGAAKYFLDNIPWSYWIYTAGVYGTHKWASPAEPTDQVIYPASMSGTHCYIVHNSFYDTFLAMDENEHLDVALSNEHSKVMGGDKLCITMPPKMCAIQQPGYSDIMQQEVDYNHDKWLQWELYRGEQNEN